MNEIMKGVCRKASAIPGLLNIWLSTVQKVTYAPICLAVLEFCNFRSIDPSCLPFPGPQVNLYQSRPDMQTSKKSASSLPQDFLDF